MAKPTDTDPSPGLLVSEMPDRDPALEHQVYVQLVRTQDRLGSKFEALYREYGLSRQQYSALRVIGANPDGVSCGELRDGLATRVPDVTRLVDRLLKQGWVHRRNADDDRRSVIVSLTEEGHDLLNKLAEPVTNLSKQQLGHLSQDELLTLYRLLIRARSQA